MSGTDEQAPPAQGMQCLSATHHTPIDRTGWNKGRQVDIIYINTLLFWLKYPGYRTTYPTPPENTPNA